MPPAEEAKNNFPRTPFGLHFSIDSKSLLISADSLSISLGVEPTIDRPAHQAIDQLSRSTDLKNSSQSRRSEVTAEL